MSVPNTVRYAALAVWALLGLAVLRMILTVAFKDDLVDAWIEDKAPGLASHLLRTVRLRLTITVSEGGNIIFGGSAGPPWGVGHGIGQRPAGFPPHAEYCFEFAPRAGLLVLTQGPRPVFYSRSVHTTFQYPFSELRIGGPDDGDRLAYLHAMDPWSEPMLRADTGKTGAWTTPEALVERIADLRKGLEHRFRSMRTRIEATCVRYRGPASTSSLSSQSEKTAAQSSPFVEKLAAYK
jgi:hypothetical protein